MTLYESQAAVSDLSGLLKGIMEIFVVGIFQKFALWRHEISYPQS